MGNRSADGNIRLALELIDRAQTGHRCFEDGGVPGADPIEICGARPRGLVNTHATGFLRIRPRPYLLRDVREERRKQSKKRAEPQSQCRDGRVAADGVSYVLCPGFY